MEAGYAETSQAFFIQCWFGRARVPQISDKHPTSMDTQRTNIAQAHRARDRTLLFNFEALEEESPKGASGNENREEAAKNNFAALGDCL